MPDPSLADVNSEYDVWVKNYEITSGDNSFCNNISKYEGDSPKHLDVQAGKFSSGNKRMFDYYICGDYGPNDPDCNERVDAAGDACQCIGVTFNKWNTFYDNCQGDPRSEKFSEDKCINMATQDTPGVSNFVMGRFADETNVYNPHWR